MHFDWLDFGASGVVEGEGGCGADYSFLLVVLDNAAIGFVRLKPATTFSGEIATHTTLK